MPSAAPDITRVAQLCDTSAIHAYGVTVEALSKLNRAFDRRLRQECGITIAWFEALLRVGRHGGSMKMSELAAQLSLTNGGVTRMVDRMAEAGFIRRDSYPGDRRVSYASLTDAGISKWQEASELHVEDLRREFTGRMTPEELDTVIRVMDRIRS
jgi:DNA-binding MarR family transcriptional regulator